MQLFYHIAASYGVNETTAIRASHWVEDVLSKCKEFKLPSKRKLLESDMEYEVFLIDATEIPIERPIINSKEKEKKRKTVKNIKKEKIYKNSIIQEKNIDIQLKHK